MTKAELRKTVLAARKEGGISAAAADVAVKKLILMPEFAAAPLVLCYCSVGNEFPTGALIDAAFAAGKAVALPVTESDFSLTFRLYLTGDELKAGRFGIPEPSGDRVTYDSRTVCIVPALAVSPAGHRVGYGKGCYDRFLCGFSGFSVSPVESHFFLSFEEDVNDVPLNAAVTENEIIRF